MQRMLVLVMLYASIVYSQEKFRTDLNPVKIAGGDESYFMNPKWSPDGRLLAFTESNYIGLWTLNLEINNLIKISNDQGVGFGYQWSEDGAQILARSTKNFNGKNKNAIKLINVANKQETILVDYNERITTVPVYAGNGTAIIFEKENRAAIISTGKLAKSSIVKPSCYMESGKIVVESNDQSKLVLDPIPGSDYLNFEVSPNGAFILFEVMGGNLFTMKTDGSELSDLGRGYRAQWSPDSKNIIFMITEDDGHHYTSADLFITDHSGHDFIQFTDTEDILEMNPGWSPDGKRITYHDANTGAIWIKPLAE